MLQVLTVGLLLIELMLLLGSPWLVQPGIMAEARLGGGVVSATEGRKHLDHAWHVCPVCPAPQTQCVGAECCEGGAATDVCVGQGLCRAAVCVLIRIDVTWGCNMLERCSLF